jgi:hypothetical protein
MTAFEFTPASPEVQPTDLLEAIREAQAMGDWAYRIQEWAGYSPADCADAYHTAFVESMQALGWPMPCACDFCRGALTLYRWVDPLTAEFEEFVA